MLTSNSSRAPIWRRIVDDIVDLVERGCYERVNEFMSLGTVDRLRRLASRELGENVDIVLDAGAGPGYSSVHICREKTPSKVILLDPSPHLLSDAIDRLRAECGDSVIVQPIVGLFEYAPFAESSIDAVVSMFALRDAVDFEAAVRDLSRVLRTGGILVVLDIYKPERLLERAAVMSYFSVMPALGSLLTGCMRSVKNYVTFLRTIEYMMSPKGLTSLLGKYFSSARFRSLYPGVGLWTAFK